MANRCKSCAELRNALYALCRLIIIEQLVTPDMDEFKHAMEILARHDAANQSLQDMRYACSNSNRGNRH